ncbi:protein-glutamine gamma-glutamyltransferase [Paenibacillus gansuensis]|uniref:Protein-glutamine gamma-glutamyltransferase n=1 Tax=Paenibacillus gansuensis TaxID=306542 RepID=A0ABW5PCI2_9BACL
MILLSGQPVREVSGPLTPLEQFIVNEKMMSMLPYSYETEDQLRFELKVRLNLVEASKQMCYSRVQFGDFPKSRCNPAYWIRMPNGGFRQRPDVRSSEAISDFFLRSEFYTFECATAIIILMYKAVLETIGAPLFNTYFRNLVLFTWNTDEDLRIITRPSRESFPGDVLYFRNPDVSPINPEWQGENVVELGNNLFYGHGTGIKTPYEIIRELNSYRRRFAFRSAYLVEQVTAPDYKYLYQLSKSLPHPLEAGYPYRGIVSKIGEFTVVAAG